MRKLNVITIKVIIQHYITFIYLKPMRLVLQMSVLRKLFQLLVFLLTAESAFAQRQEIDSLLNVIKTQKDDTVKAFLLSEVAYVYHLVYPDSTRIMAAKAYELSAKLKFERGKAHAMKHLAIGSYIGGSFTDAVEYNKKALAIYERLGDKKGKGAVLNNIAIILQDQGKYEPALTYYRQSVAIREEIRDSIGFSGGYNNMGNTYSDMGNYSESLHYLFKALQIREKIGDIQGATQSYGNIARIYLLLGKLDETLRFANKSYKMAQDMNNPDGVAHGAVIIGGVYHEKKQYQQALNYFNIASKYYEQVQNFSGYVVAQVNAAEELTSMKKYREAEEIYSKALALTTEGGDMEGIAICHIGIGLIEMKTGKTSQSIASLNEGLRISMNIGNKLRISEASKHLAEAYKINSDFKNANKALETYIIYKDSLFIEQSAKKAEEIQYNFLLDKKQKEIALLEKDNKLRENETEKQRLISWGLLIALAFVLIGLYLLFRSQQKEKQAKQLIIEQKGEIEKQAQKLEELNQLKDKTFSVLSHDLRSPVSSLIGVMSLLDQKMLSKEEFSSLQSSFGNQLRSLGYVLDNLLYWSKSHMSGKGVSNKVKLDLPELAKQNLNLLHEPAAQKNISIDISPVMYLPAFADKDDIDIVLRNLISNAIKFTNNGGEIKLSTMQVNGFVYISVADNGVGIDEETLTQLLSNNPKKASFGTKGEKGTGIGLLICKELIEKNGGALSVKSEKGKGSTFTFTLPLA